MKEKILIIGGCRSGKSSFALRLANQICEKSSKKKIFIATGIPFDDEMKKRILNHKKERDIDWETVEEPINLVEVIKCFGEENLILIDCITLWITNIMLKFDQYSLIEGFLKNLMESIKQAKSDIILVSNEVGCGIVPENKLAREFRDNVGYANQKLAELCNKVIWTVAGIPVYIKGKIF